MLFFPERKELPIPKSNEIASIMQRVQAKQTAQLVEKSQKGPLMKTLPQPGKVVSTRSIPELKVEVLKLSNGMTVWLKKTDFRKESIIIQAWSPGGRSLSKGADYINSLLIKDIMLYSGLGDWSFEQLIKRMKGESFGAFPTFDSAEELIRGGGITQKQEDLFQFVHLLFTQPRFDAKGLELVLQSKREAINNSGKTPQSIFNKAKNKVLYPDNPRYRLWELKDLEQVSLTTARKIYPRSG